MYLKFGQVCIWPSKSVVQALCLQILKKIPINESDYWLYGSLVWNAKQFTFELWTFQRLQKPCDIERTCRYCTKWGHYICQSTLHRQHFWPWNCFTKWNIVPILWWWWLCNGRQGVSDPRHPAPWCRSEHPTLLGSDAQMSAEDVVRTQQIASLRIHVERAINKIKNFRIWNGVVPLSLFSVVNQMWTVCAFLCNTQDPLISNITWSVYAILFY